MKSATTLLVLLAGLLLTTPARAQDTASEEEAIRAAVAHYFQGHATGDGSHFEQVFHPASMLFWVRDGQFNQRTSEAYIAGAPGKPADDEAQRQRRIALIDITGNAAVVKVQLDYPSALITDYFSLLKNEGQWLCCMNRLARRTGPNPAAPLRLPRSSPAFPTASSGSKPGS